MIDLEPWLTEQGASELDIGEPAMHRQPRSTPKSRHRLAKLQNGKDAALCARRAELRAEYERLVAAGELRPRTRRERLEDTAAGHPDNPSVQAARRILARGREI